MHPLRIGIFYWVQHHLNGKTYGILLGIDKIFQKFKHRQNYNTSTEVNLSKNAKMGKQLQIRQFWPKILFFSWIPQFGSYIDDQNLNGPFGLKRADSGCPWPFGPWWFWEKIHRVCNFFIAWDTNFGPFDWFMQWKRDVFCLNWLIGVCTRFFAHSFTTIYIHIIVWKIYHIICI